MMLGLFTVQKDVSVRKEPRVVEYKIASAWITNKVGSYSPGRQVEILEIYVDNSNWAWGRVSQPESHGQSQWVCISNVQTTFLKPIESSSGNGENLTLEQRIERLENAARSHGIL